MTRTHPGNGQELNESRRNVCVRSAVAGDVPRIVKIHQRAFNSSFLTRLGAKFLKHYYGLVLNYHYGIVLVSERSGALEGFACGFLDPAEFYRLMWRNRWTFAPIALLALVRQPALAMDVFNGIQRVQQSASQHTVRSCELSSIAIAPEASGKGSGKALLQAFIARAWSMDAERVYLNTDANDNDQANALYQRVGFHCTHRFLQSRRRWMNEYVIDESCQRSFEYAAK